MNVEQRVWRPEEGWQVDVSSVEILADEVQLVLVFGDYNLLHQHDMRALLRSIYPNAIVLGCSACGAIHGAEIIDDAVVATAIQFEQTSVRMEWVPLSDSKDSCSAGEQLASLLSTDDLKHVLVISDGLNVDGDALAKGLCARLPEGVLATGGLAADAEKFADTIVIADGSARGHGVAAVGFYGDALSIGYGCFGGWDSFGLTRTVTRAEGNVLYEIDGESALSLYRRYLGDFAEGLPATALYFPLNLSMPGSCSHLVRSVLSIDEEKESLIFAGDIPQGTQVTLMKATLNRLVDGARLAGEMSLQGLTFPKPTFSLLVSCTARKMVLKQRTEEETEAVQDVLGESCCMAGFYSFGEICPAGPGLASCALHNQTMTLTTFTEKDG